MTVSVYLTADHEAAHTRRSHFCSDECHGCHLHRDLAVRQHLGEFKEKQRKRPSQGLGLNTVSKL